MDKEDIIRMARKEGVDNSWDINWFDPYYACFAKLVAAAEREACAVIAFNAKTYLEAAAAIRARGKS